MLIMVAMQKRDIILMKIATFIVLFFLIGLIPIFILFDVVEKTTSSPDGDEISYTRTYYASIFYRSVVYSDFKEPYMPRYEIALVLNILLGLVYASVIYFAISIFWFSRISVASPSNQKESVFSEHSKDTSKIHHTTQDQKAKPVQTNLNPQKVFDTESQSVMMMLNKKQTASNLNQRNFSEGY